MGCSTVGVCVSDAMSLDATSSRGAIGQLSLCSSKGSPRRPIGSTRDCHASAVPPGPRQMYAEELVKFCEGGRHVLLLVVQRHVGGAVDPEELLRFLCVPERLRRHVGSGGLSPDDHEQRTGCYERDEPESIEVRDAVQAAPGKALGRPGWNPGRAVILPAFEDVPTERIRDTSLRAQSGAGRLLGIREDGERPRRPRRAPQRCVPQRLRQACRG